MGCTRKLLAAAAILGGLALPGLAQEGPPRYGAGAAYDDTQVPFNLFSRSDNPFANWHLGIRGGTYSFLSLDKGYFDRAYMAGLFWQSPMLEESNFKFEIAFDYGEHEGDENLAVPQHLREEARRYVGSLADSEVQANWKGTVFQLRADALWFPFFQPDTDPGIFQPYLFAGIGWSGQDVNGRIEAQTPIGDFSRQFEETTDNVILGQFGAAFQFAFHPCAVADVRLGLDVYTNSSFADGMYFVTLGMGF